MEMQVINITTTKTSRGKQSMNTEILLCLRDTVYIYLKASLI